MPIAPGLTNLDSLFAGDKLFEIPIYQRPYSWGEKQIDDLFEDLSFQGKNKSHFFGTILLKDLENDDGNFEVFEIVDGQQRVTTIILLINEIINKLTNTHKKQKSKLTERYIKDDSVYKIKICSEDRLFFQNFIIDRLKSPKNPTTPSQNRLLSAKNYISTYLESYDEKNVLEMVNKVKKFNILVYVVDSNSDATLIFETTNDRGKGLSNLEKTKSFLMHKVYLCSKFPESELDTINRIFAQIYVKLDFLENNEFYKIDEERVQRYHYILTGAWKEKTDYQNDLLSIKKEIKDFIINKKNAELLIHIKTYTTGLLETFEILEEIIKEAQKSKSKVGKTLEDIFLMGRLGTVFPIVIATFKQYREKKCTNDELFEILNLISKASFRVYGIGKKRSDTHEWSWFAWAYNLYGAHNDFKKTLDEIIQHIRTQVPKTAFEEKLSSSNFYTTIGSNDKKFLLLKYEEYLRESQPKEPFPLKRKEIFSTDYEIEHILSRSNSYSDDFNEKYLHRLGNLAISSKPANGSMSNKNFSDKAKNYYSKSDFRMQRQLSTLSKWNSKNIMGREKLIITFAMNNWKI